MKIRYGDGDDRLTQVFLDVLEKYFPELGQLSVKLIFDFKKRIKQGKLILASIERTSDKIRFFSKNKIAVDGYDLILIVDNIAWTLSNDADKERIIRHELRHIFLDEDNKIQLVGHDVEDFREELTLNEDNPLWSDTLSVEVINAYITEKENGKE
jgi:hypothetical protein